MAKENKKPVADKPKIDESDYQERIEGFFADMQKLFGKYEIQMVPTAQLVPTKDGHMVIRPATSFPSSRGVVKQEQPAEEKPDVDLIKE